MTYYFYIFLGLCLYFSSKNTKYFITTHPSHSIHLDFFLALRKETVKNLRDIALQEKFEQKSILNRPFTGIKIIDSLIAPTLSWKCLIHAFKKIESVLKPNY